MKTFSNILIAEQNDGMGAEGLSKARLKTLLYKETKKCTYNKLYKDTGWNGPQCIWNTFDKLRLNWHLTGNEYHTEKNPAKSMTYQMPTRKEWRFEISFDNNKGKYTKLQGHVTAAGAGSVDDPLSRYDVTMVIW